MDTPSGKLPKNHPLFAPGLKWRARTDGAVPMWFPTPKDIKAGYAPRSLMLKRDATPAEIAATCRRQWDDLLKWREERFNAKPLKMTISWLIDEYQTKSMTYRKLKPETKQSYGWECARIRETIGERQLGFKTVQGHTAPRIVGEDIRRWFHEWGHPEGKDPTPSRATHCIAMLRTLMTYAVEIGVPGASDLRGMLAVMQFEKPAPRTMAPTYAQVDALVNTAMDMGYRSIAITTLAQYELIERRAHIIGQWDGDAWGNGWVWEGVSPDWTISYYQTKKGRMLRQFDLKPVQRLLGLMQETAKENRSGPIIICEDTGEPWIKRRYQETFREIARAAGVPDEVYSMDMRSGGVTEADGIEGVTPRMIQDGAGHRDIQTQEIYRRNRQRNANKVVQLRQAARDKQ